VMMYGYGSYGNMMGGFGGWLFLLFGLLVLAGFVLLVVWAMRSMSGSAQHPQPPSSTGDACAIAKVRYAKGEITKEQYEEICKTLGV
jgi:putative membrane protein